VEKNAPKFTLLIATYNWPAALDLVLKSVQEQSVLPYEICIADDGSKPDTAALIASYIQKIPVPIHHLWHEDKGFRKTIILNQAIKKATGDYIIQIDGDIILHRHFIRDHIDNATEGYFVKGSRARLTEERSKQVLLSKNIHITPFQPGVKSTINGTHIPFVSPLFFGKPHNSRNVKGCNFAVWKKDFVAVNGYNNEMYGWGHEDIELAARLINNGTKHKQLKMTAVCFHIFHPLQSRSEEDSNYHIYATVVDKQIQRCSNGYDQS
jgi:glycosyltransferase involved in cell wall biosynthesis